MARYADLGEAMLADPKAGPPVEQFATRSIELCWQAKTLREARPSDMFSPIPWMRSVWALESRLNSPYGSFRFTTDTQPLRW
jgi:hypothetical protein